METNGLNPGWEYVQSCPVYETTRGVSSSLPADITRAASQRTFHIIQRLVDRNRSQDAYRAYAYFRWVDDWIDRNPLDRDERIAFVQRQQTLMDQAYQGERPRHLAPEEYMLFDLVQTDRDPNSGLGIYIRQLMAVMVFDAKRRGRLISARELDEYTHWLAVGVTEALHYFIGHDDPTPHTATRYLAVTAAHITHMLRDTCEDLAAGYINIPSEYLAAHAIDPSDVRSETCRAWVQSRVQLARDYFKAGRAYLTQVHSLRCRMAGYAYCAQFEHVLDTLERQAYRLHFDEPDEKI